MTLRLILFVLAVILMAYRLTEYADKHSPTLSHRCVRIFSTSFCLVMACTVGYLSAGWSLAVPASIIGVILGYALANVYDDFINHIEARVSEIED